MTFVNNEESKQEVDETTDQVALTDESNTDESQLSEESKTHDSEGEGEEGDDDQFDYQAELVRERELRLKAEKEKEKAENKIVKLKKKISSEEEDEELSTEERIAQRVVSQLSSERNQEFINDVLEQASEGNPELKKLIEFHYENTIKHSGSSRQSIEEDISAAKALANRRRYESESRVLKDTLKTKATLSTVPQFNGRKVSQPKPQQKLSEGEKKLLQWAEKIKKTK